MKQIGKYEILEQIGSGGFGTVYKAQDSIGRIVAINVIKSGWSEDATVRGSLARTYRWKSRRRDNTSEEN